MFETIIVVLIVAAAGFWFINWCRGTAKGEKGCSCGHCDGSGIQKAPPCCQGQHKLS